MTLWPSYMINISLHGTRQAVKREIQAVQPEPPAKEEPQLDALKAFLISGIDSLPPEFTGCRVDATGGIRHGCLNVSVNIIPQKFLV